MTDYVFDDLGRLESVSDGLNPVSYVYDSLDRVVARESGVMESFTYAGTAIDPTSDGSFVYARSPGGRVLAQQDPVSGVANLVGLNRHGDLSYLFDSAGVVSDSRVYDPFGDEAAETGSTDPTLGFQGDFTDPVTDHVWMGARWYDGGWASFLSHDSVFGELRTPVTLNRYTYAGANPLRFWDPDGRRFIEGTGPGSYFYDINTCGYSGCPDEVQIGTAVRTQCVQWRDSTGCTEYEIVEVTGGLFEFDSTELPADWEFRLDDGIAASGGDALNRWVATWGYEELIRDPAHSDALTERDPTALAAFSRALAKRSNQAKTE